MYPTSPKNIKVIHQDVPYHPKKYQSNSSRCTLPPKTNIKVICRDVSYLPKKIKEIHWDVPYLWTLNIFQVLIKFLYYQPKKTKLQMATDNKIADRAIIIADTANMSGPFVSCFQYTFQRHPRPRMYLNGFTGKTSYSLQRDRCKSA